MSRREHNDKYRDDIRLGREMISARGAYVIRRFPQHVEPIMRLAMEAARTTKRKVGERVYQEIEAIFQDARRAESEAKIKERP